MAAITLGMLATSFGIVMKSISIITTRKALQEDNYYKNNTKLKSLQKKQKELAARETALRSNLHQVEKEINRAHQEKNMIIQTERTMRKSMKKGFVLYDLLSLLGATNTDELKKHLISCSRTLKS